MSNFDPFHGLNDFLSILIVFARTENLGIAVFYILVDRKLSKPTDIVSGPLPVIEATYANSFSIFEISG